jgi:hypothetical protein
LAIEIEEPHPTSVGKTPCIPPELKLRPFSLDEARDAGLTLRALSGKAWRRISAGLYRWSELPGDPWLTLSAWRRVLPSEAVFVGATAAWVFGLDIEPIDPVEVVVPASSGIRTRAGLIVHHRDIPPAEVVTIRGLRVLALPLTLAGLCLQRPAADALIAIDMAVRRGLTDSVALGRRGPDAFACVVGGSGRVADGNSTSLASDPGRFAPARGPGESP